jgi:ligand-binding SRPBCC domain-containing protein
MSELFVKRSHFDVPAERLLAWHAQPGALERLTPPWERLEVAEPAPSLENGSCGVLRLHLGPFPIRWQFEHRDYHPGRQFRDVMIGGPFRRWEHTHQFTPDGPQACWLEDRIDYDLPFGWLGKLLGARFTRRKLEKLFDYRHRITAEAMSSGPEPSDPLEN